MGKKKDIKMIKDNIILIDTNKIDLIKGITNIEKIIIIKIISTKKKDPLIIHNNRIFLLCKIKRKSKRKFKNK